jgi:ribosomal protein S18 acetylase RimI-like enzyme
MLQIVHPSLEEINAVLDFLNACDIAEYGEADSVLEELQEEWENIDLARDAWLLKDETKIFGYACLSGRDARYQFDLYLDMEFSAEGWKDQLVHKAIDRIREIKQQKSDSQPLILTAYASSVNTGLNEVLLRNGFKAHIWQYRMQIELNKEFEPMIWPADFVIRPFEPKDEVALFQLITSTFDWEGHSMPTIEGWREHLFRGGRFDPLYFVMVLRGGELVGAALSYKEDSLGWIRQLAISKKLQGQGFGSKLLKHMFHEFQKAGMEKVALGVASTNQNAFVFYERCGMKQVRKYTEYQMEIDTQPMD